MIYGENTTRNELDEIELVRPANAGSYWHGIRHSDLIDTIDDAVLCRAGWSADNWKFSVSPDKCDLAATTEVVIDGIDPPTGQTLSMGILTSNARRRATTVVVGTNVNVCTNGMCTGEIVLRAKHTKGFDMGREIGDGLRRYAKEAEKIKKLVASLQGKKIHDSDANHVLMEAGRQRLMSWGRIGQVDQEYRQPRHDEHAEYLGTSWCLLNAFTEIVKSNNPLRQMDCINKFRAMLPMAVA